MELLQASSRDSGYPEWDREQWNSRGRSGSICGSDVSQSRLQRKGSNSSSIPSRNLPLSTSVFDLNAPMPHQTHPHGFYPIQQV